jgi:hypothetical protein
MKAEEAVRWYGSRDLAVARVRSQADQNGRQAYG